VEANDIARIPLMVSKGCVVASIQQDLRGEVLQQFRSDLLERLRSSGANGVVIDLSGLSLMDADDFEGIQQTLDMAMLMGARTVLVGLRPGVVSALVELGVEPGNFDTLLDLDDAFALFEKSDTVEEEGEEEQTTGEGAPEDDVIHNDPNPIIHLIGDVSDESEQYSD
jgi:rsbT antagonist protein RsbS